MKTILLFVLCFGYGYGQLCARVGRHLLQHSCVLSPEGTEGPYYLPYHLVRSDIRENRPGIPLKLKFTITDVTKCELLKNVSVDIWQADGLGMYSSYTKNKPNTAPRSVLHATPTDNSTFLRGVQFTNDAGQVEFMTVFPGSLHYGCFPNWHFPSGQYAFRTPHIHMQAHIGGKTVHVAQLYFTNQVNSRIHRLSPYKQTTGKATQNEDDYIFVRDNGDSTIIQNIQPLDGKRTSRGLKGEMILGINPNHESSKALRGRAN